MAEEFFKDEEEAEDGDQEAVEAPVGTPASTEESSVENRPFPGENEASMEVDAEANTEPLLLDADEVKINHEVVSQQVVLKTEPSKGSLKGLKT